MICPCCGKHKKPADLDGLGTALKPAMELICIARKPLSEATISANVLRWGCGALNIDGCRVGTDAGWSYPNGRGGSGWHGRESLASNLTEPMEATQGRWPANLILAGDEHGNPVEEVLAGFPETGASKAGLRGIQQRHDVSSPETARPKAGTNTVRGIDDNGGSAARFFYCAKSDSSDRAGSRHPTIKPVDLMAYLVRLVTPKGGTVLDPFAGSGTTGEAAMREGCKAILIEREPAYFEDIQNRMKMALAGPEERSRAIIKASGKLETISSLPLFSEAAE